MDSDFCTVCYKPVKDSHALYCSPECTNNDGSSQLNSNTPPPSPPAHLRFSISLMPNTYYASEANSNKVLSPPSSVSSSYSDSDVSSFTSVHTFDEDFGNFDGYKEEAFDDEYNPSIYSTSNPIDIPKTRSSNDSILPLNKSTFGED